MTRAAKIISVLFHPVFMPSLGLFLLLSINSHIQTELTPEVQRLLLIWIFVITGIFPIISALVFLRSGIISSLQMENKRERIGPYLLTAFYYGLAYYMLRKSDLPDALFALLLGATLSILFITIISWFWKISAHMVGIGGVIGAIVGFAETYNMNLGAFVAGLVLLAGVVATSRLWLGSHKPLEIYGGVALGFSLLYCSLKFMVVF